MHKTAGGDILYDTGKKNWGTNEGDAEESIPAYTASKMSVSLVAATVATEMSVETADTIYGTQD